MRVSKAEQAERDEAIRQLREWIKPGDTVYTILDHVSKSGMMRAIRVLIAQQGGGFLHPNYAVGKACGYTHWTRNGRQQDALKVTGCGMDMGFALVYNLSSVLYGKGYKCPGKGKCNSADHRNSRPDRDDYSKRRVHVDGYAIRQQWL